MKNRTDILLFTGIIFLLITHLILGLSSCKDKQEEKIIIYSHSLKQTAQTTFTASQQNIKGFDIDSCEYLGKSDSQNNIIYLTHKGNCTYCQNRLAVAIESIVKKVLENQIE